MAPIHCNMYSHKMTDSIEGIHINHANDDSKYGISECNFAFLQSFLVFSTSFGSKIVYLLS